MSEEKKTLDAGMAKEEPVRDIPIQDLDVKRLIQLDACTRCGECQRWCPVYDQDQQESLIPRRKVIEFLKIASSQHSLLSKILDSGKAGSGLKSLLGRVLGYRKIGREEIDQFVNSLYECSTCGQCEVVCPAHIDTVSLWEELRRLIVKSGYGPLEPQKALEKSVKAFDNPWQQPRAARTKWARRAKKEGLIQVLPREIRKTRGKVLLFFGCTAAYDVNVKQVAVNTINILETLDIDYGVLGSEEKCCGSVLLRMGDPEHKRLFKENIDLFNNLGIETLISSCSGCFKTILQDYPHVAPVNFEVLHTVEYLARMVKTGELKFTHPVHRTVTFHDPCHLGRATNGFEGPRIIMDAIPGLSLKEMPRSHEYSRCCGAGGGLKAGFPDIQNKMAQRRIREAEETGAESLVSCCPFCYQGLNVGISSLESQLVMRDISSLVAESLLGYDVFEQAHRPVENNTPQKSGGSSDRKKEREERRAARKAKKELKCENVPPAPDDDTADAAELSRQEKKAQRQQARADRRAKRKAPDSKTVSKTDAKPAPKPESEPPVVAVPEKPPEAIGPPVDDPVDMSKEEKKTARLKARAERRAAREKAKSAADEKK
ncbi:MAG: hypothetical protein HKM93_10970 [Desulfobacteraceae bacterium]|nr:hypothetical protein [Desulfobacteraceae bacterium]